MKDSWFKHLNPKTNKRTTKHYSKIFIIKKTTTCWLKLNKNDIKNLIQFLILYETHATDETITITYQ